VRSEERERTCTAGGAQLLAKSTTTFTEDFRPAELERVPRPEVIIELLSDGVLVPGKDSTAFRFFHQSFAEWVIARHVAASEANRATFVTALADPVRRGYLAPVLVQLLYALDEDAAYRNLVAALDLDELLCFRAVALSAVVHDDLHQLNVLIAHARIQSTQHQQHLIEAMASAGEAITADAVTLLVEMCDWVHDAAVFDLAKAMGELTARVPGDRSDAMGQALDAVGARRRTISNTSRGDTLVLVVLREFDPPLRPLTDAERAVLRAHLLVIAVANRLPPQATASAVGVATVIFQDTNARDRLGWTDWRVMLSSRYANGWDDVQMRLLAEEIVHRQGATLADLLDFSVTGDKVLSERALHVARTVTELSPDTAVDLLTGAENIFERRSHGQRLDRSTGNGPGVRHSWRVPRTSGREARLVRCRSRVIRRSRGIVRRPVAAAFPAVGW
jgi:hypothetical protein